MGRKDSGEGEIRTGVGFPTCTAAGSVDSNQGGKKSQGPSQSQSRCSAEAQEDVIALFGNDEIGLELSDDLAYLASFADQPELRRALPLEMSLRTVFASGWDRPEPPEVRTTVLGHIQRGGSPCAYDRLISLRFGAQAMQLALAGQWGRMVCLRGTEIADVPLSEGIGQLHNVPIDSQLLSHARAVGVCLGD